MKLYLKFLSIHLRSAMTYRSSFLLSCLGHLLITTNEIGRASCRERVLRLV